MRMGWIFIFYWSCRARLCIWILHILQAENCCTTFNILTFWFEFCQHVIQSDFHLNIFVPLCNVYYWSDVHVTMHLDRFLIINQQDALISQIYFGMKLYMFWTVPLVHHQQFFTVHTAVVYVIQVCWQLACRILRASCHLTCMTYTFAVCTVKNC
jgi:hypothetical protein